MRRFLNQRSGVLRRISADHRGNVMVIMAASLVPILAAVGGAVDLARVYTADQRLQQATDAAVLAGRKVMVNNDVETARDAVHNFLVANYPDGIFQSSALPSKSDLGLSLSEQGELSLTVNTTVPMQVMNIFGFDSIGISASSSARRSGVNVDVVLVLDTTGSMSFSMSGSNNGSDERIKALRKATGSFLGILDDLRDQLESSGLRVRVGIVPYSTAVNVGHDLYDESSSYIATTNVQYHSSMLGLCKASSSNKYCGTNRSSNNNKWYHNDSSGSWTGSKYSGEAGVLTLDLSDYVSRGRTAAGSNAYAWLGCVEARSTVQSINSGSNFMTIPANAWDIIDTAPGTDGAPKFAPYLFLPNDSRRYGPPSSSQSTATTWKFAAPYVASQVPYEISEGNTTASARRSAVSNSTYSANPHGTTGPNYGCPSRVKLLAEKTQSDLQSYLDDLTPVGNTFHDVGMYWGLALISPGAPFTNPDTFADRPVKRYIVFMTDGDLNAAGDTYSSYGLETRPTGTGNHVTTTRDSQPDAEHRARFRMLCEAAKRQGVEVSTIAFSSSVSSSDKASLKGCANTEDNYYVTNTASGLEDTFKKIAQNIGYLRISR